MDSSEAAGVSPVERLSLEILRVEPSGYVQQLHGATQWPHKPLVLEPNVDCCAQW